jgi:hypothetical protein
MSDFVTALQASIEAQTSEINTSQPGVLVSYDPDRNRAVVRPAMQKRLADGSALDAPQIFEVPVVWPMGAGGTAGLTLPIKPGDGMLLHFSQRSLEGWASGDSGAPDDPRHFDLSDAVATPGLVALGITVNATDAEFRFGDAKLRLRPDGGAVLEVAGGSLTIDADGTAAFVGPKVTVSGDVEVVGYVTAGTVSLRNHVHLGVQPGGGLSGIPLA